MSVRRLPTALVFAALYLGAGFLGRQTILEGAEFSLVWPAAGVGVLWFLVQRARPVSVDTVLLAAAAFGANRLTGAPLDLSLVLVLSNVTQTLLAVHLLRRWCPELWGCGGDRSLDSPWMTARYVAALAVGMAAGMAVGMTGTLLAGGDVDVAEGVLWFDRNLCGALAVTTLGLLLGQRYSRPAPRPQLVVGGLAVVELAAALLFTAATYTLAFAFAGLPVAFLLLIATVWVGVRYPTLVSVGHSFVVGAVTVVLTLAGSGPFADLASAQTGVLLAQLFLVMLIVSGLFLSTGRDERQALDEELRESRAEAIYQADLLEAMVNSVVEGLAIVAEDGDLLLLNPAAADMLGKPSTGTVTNVHELGDRHLDGRPLADDERPAMRALRGETVSNVELVVGEPGRERILSVSAAPLPRGTKDGRARAVILARDATSEHAQRAELASFAGVVAHDLRNPLAAITGWTELVEDEAAVGDLHPELVRDFVDRVRAATDRMNGLVVHLLAHATSQYGQLAPVPTDLRPSVMRIAASREATAYVSCRDLPEVVADRVLVEQVLDNLIGNALKYVADGVPPDVVVSGRRTDDGWVAISVADNGIGLPPGEHEAIFDEFHRVHTREYEGTGLGLAIAKRIVLRHGGTISARDNDECGTVVEFTLPAST